MKKYTDQLHFIYKAEKKGIPVTRSEVLLNNSEADYFDLKYHDLIEETASGTVRITLEGRKFLYTYRYENRTRRIALGGLITAAISIGLQLLSAILQYIPTAPQ